MCILYTALLWLVSTIVTTLVISFITSSYYSSYVPSIILIFWAYRIICNGHTELRYYNHELISFRDFSKSLRSNPNFKREHFETISDQDAEIFRRWDTLEKPIPANNSSTKVEKKANCLPDSDQSRDDEDIIERSLVDPVFIGTTNALTNMDEIMTLSPAQRKNLDELDSPTPIKYCRKCGLELPPNSRFCNNCGAKIKKVP